MNRQLFIAFLTANMKAVVIPHVKENKSDFGMSGTVTQSSIKAYLANANTSDEDVQALAEACGYVEGATTSSAPSIKGINAEAIEIDIDGETVSVPCYMLQVSKWDFVKSRKGTLTPCLKLAFNGGTLKCFSELFREKSVRDAIQIGDIIAVKAGAGEIETINGIGRNNVPYTTYNGAVLEASVPALVEARFTLNERAVDLAGMSVAGQSMLTETSAKAEVQAFLAKHGR